MSAQFFGKGAGGGDASSRMTADVRVDEEGKAKFQQILDLLLAGGFVLKNDLDFFDSLLSALPSCDSFFVLVTVVVVCFFSFVLR